MSRMKKFLSSLLGLLCLFGLTSCEDANSKYYDSIVKTFTLEKPYETRDFIEDGIGLATVDAYTDGDTTRFKLESGEVVAIRYDCIDTPESTGSIEKWGKAASLFTKTMLKQATEIVLEATAEVAKHDSYGVRYLGFVWYKTASDNNFRNLNVQIVENGFSKNKAGASDKYYTYFKKAETFATEKGLRVYAPATVEDPLYSTEPIDFTLKEFYENTDAYYNTDSGSGSKVKVPLIITDLYVGTSGTYNFTGTELDGTTEYTIQVYTGYKDSGIKIGHEYYIVGNVDNYYGKWQIAGVIYDSSLTELNRPDTYSYINRRSVYYSFNSSTDKDKIRIFSPTYNSDLTVTEVSKEENRLVIVGTAFKYTSGKIASATTSYTIYVPIDSTYNNTISVGKVLRFGAFSTGTTNTFEVLGLSSITIN